MRTVVSPKREQPIVSPRRKQPEPPVIGPVAIFITLGVLLVVYTVVRDFYESNSALTIIGIVILVGIVGVFSLLSVKVVGNLITRDFRKEEARLSQHAEERRQHVQQQREQQEEERRRKHEQQEEERKREEQERAEQIEAMLERDTFRESVHYMEGVEFEDFMANVFDKKGYHVQTTPTTGDQGVDLLLTIDDLKVAVQLKRYTGPVGPTAVAAVVAGMFHYKAKKAWVITTSSFTKGAVELAKSNRVRLMDGKELEDWLNDLRDEF